MTGIADDWTTVLSLGLLTGMVMLTSGCIGSVSLSDTYDMVTENICEKMSGMERDHCYQNSARIFQDKAQCAKINHPGPRSKCWIYLGDCGNDDLQWKATADGAYTKNDCNQYKAIQYQSLKLCYEMQADYQSGGNDLNPIRVSRETCIKRVTEKCGHIGQEVCIDTYINKKYCLEGQMDMGKCVPAT